MSMPSSMFNCRKCGESLECLGGCSAHSDNWYCPKCDGADLSREISERPAQFVSPALTIEQQLEAANQRELELLAVIDDARTALRNHGMYEVADLLFADPSQALREHEAKVIEECAGLARDYSDRQGNIYSADYLSLLGSMAEERRKK